MRQGLMLVGSYPPPYGGCSVHVERLRLALADDFDVAVVDLYGEPDDGEPTWLVRCGRVRPFNALRALLALRRGRASLVHFHVASMDAFLIAGYAMLAVLPVAARTIITVHGGAFVARFEQGPAWRRALLGVLLKRFDRIVTVSDAQRAFLERLGICADRVTVVPAFLPPVATETPRARAVFESLGSCARIVMSSGCGLPYYGFHTVLDALERARALPGRTGVIFCTYDSFDEAYMKQLDARLRARGSSALARDLAPGEFAWLLKNCDVYVRATDRDGDAVSVREAGYYGKTVIASDCVTRPAEVVRFRTGDADSLARALDATRDAPASGAPHQAVDTLGALRSVYASALSARTVEVLRATP